MEFYTMLTSYVTLFLWKGEGPKGGGWPAFLGKAMQAR